MASNTALENRTTADTIRSNIQVSDAWAARATFILGRDYEAFMQDCGFTDVVKHDKVFFENFYSFFKENGHFTPRQLWIARVKIREEHVQYLTKLANV
jgi:hypothetical protein